MDKRIVITALVSAIGGGAVGGIVTYLTVKKTFEARAQKDIDDVKKEYSERFDGMRVVPKYGNMPGPAPEVPTEVSVPDLTKMSATELKQARDFVNALGYQSAEAAVEAEEQIERSHSIYDSQETPKDVPEVESRLLIGYDATALRKAKKPYLISHEDFATTETEFTKSSLIYYEEDDTLTDEGDMPITDMDSLIGEEHLEFFGIKSGGDKNQVFVRNGQISTDFEITRHAGSYTEQFLKIPKDSDKVGTRRMRDGDDG